MNINTKAKALSPDGETEVFGILAGVLQDGDTLVPFLFVFKVAVLVVDYVLRQTIDGNDHLSLTLEQGCVKTTFKTTA